MARNPQRQAAPDLLPRGAAPRYLTPEQGRELIHRIYLGAIKARSIIMESTGDDRAGQWIREDLNPILFGNEEYWFEYLSELEHHPERIQPDAVHSYYRMILDEMELVMLHSIAQLPWNDIPDTWCDGWKFEAEYRALTINGLRYEAFRETLPERHRYGYYRLLAAAWPVARMLWHCSDGRQPKALTPAQVQELADYYGVSPKCRALQAEYDAWNHAPLEPGETRTLKFGSVMWVSVDWDWVDGDQIDLTQPVIMIQVEHKGERTMVFADGYHRLARAAQEGVGLRVYVITEEEDKQIRAVS